MYSGGMPKLRSHTPDLTATEIIASYDDFIRWAEDRVVAAEAQAELARAEVAKLQAEREVLITALERAEAHESGTHPDDTIPKDDLAARCQGRSMGSPYSC